MRHRTRSTFIEVIGRASVGILKSMLILPLFLYTDTSFSANANALAGANCDQTTGYDAIIIGAGLSGLTVAKELQHQGRSVLVLEANNRIGGRGYVGYVKVPGDKQPVAIDYGGAWLHGVATNPLTGLVDAYGFQRARSKLDFDLFLGNKRPDEGQLKEGIETYSAFMNAITMAAAREEAEQVLLGSLCEGGNAICAMATPQVRLTSDSLLTYLPDTTNQRLLDIIKGMTASLDMSVEFNAASAVDLAEFKMGDDDLVTQGIGSFVKKYGEHVPVCLNSPVEKVDYQKSGVTVSVKGGKSYTAHTAVVTVSTGVLNKGLIKFNPELPGWKKTAYQDLPMGDLQKIIMPLKPESPLSNVEKPGAWVSYQGPVSAEETKLAEKYNLPIKNQQYRVMAFIYKPFGAPIIIGIFGGDWARVFEQECQGIATDSGKVQPCDKVAVNAAKQALTNMYGSEKMTNAIDESEIHVTRWTLAPYFLGSYSAALPGDWHKRADMARPVGIDQDGNGGAKRLFFAGEACSPSAYAGTYAGAYITGFQAAREVEDTLREEQDNEGATITEQVKVK